MDIEYLRNNGLIILECISGSKAYGLSTPTSDTDIKGIFLLPKEEFYGLEYTPQVSDASNDVVFYEFGRFMQLLSFNNPNILELLNTPESAVIYKNPFLDELDSSLILSKLCSNTFGKFAMSQIKKSKGLKKKIVNPVAEERKSVVEFCHVNYEQDSISLTQFLELKGWKQAECGLAKVPHMRDVYGLFHGDDAGFKGVAKNVDSNDVSLSSIPKGHTQEVLLYFNKDGYSTYCKEYREYWDWVANRNEDRYESTKNHGKSYDAKNMMHTFRLLEMAIEIGRDKVVNVHRTNRDFLLGIKSGKFEYEDLLRMADNKQAEMSEAFDKSDLPEKPDLDAISGLAFRIRDRFYSV